MKLKKMIMLSVFAYLLMNSLAIFAQSNDYVGTDKEQEIAAFIRTIEGSTIEVAFNPKEITINKTTSWQQHKRSEGNQPALEFSNANPATLIATLPLDTLESKESVHDKYILDLEAMTRVNGDTMRPPLCLFTWGSNFPSFKGVIESLSTKYTLFLPNGTPVRALVTIKMKQAAMLINNKQKANH